MMQIVVIIICLLAPLGILWLTYKSTVLRKVGIIIIAYVIGCTLGLTGLIPDTEEMLSVQTAVASAAIPFAIPLLLFSADLKAWAANRPAFNVRTRRRHRESVPQVSLSEHLHPCLQRGCGLAGEPEDTHRCQP